MLFTSDNGPWYGGSTGGLRGMKGRLGRRLPRAVHRPLAGQDSAGHESDEPAVNLDLFTTCLKAAGIEVPTDRTIDGLDILPILSSDAKSPHEAVFSLRQTDLCTVRSGKWKLHAPVSGPRKQKIMPKDEPWIDPAAPDGIRIFARADSTIRISILASSPATTSLAGRCSTWRKDTPRTGEPLFGGQPEGG